LLNLRQQHKHFAVLCDEFCVQVHFNQMFMMPNTFSYMCYTDITVLLTLYIYIYVYISLWPWLLAKQGALSCCCAKDAKTR
jgi:hypothetical protein